MNLLFTIESIILIRIIIGEQEWNYDKFGPDVWGKYFKDCNGINQSPINIKTACTTYQKFEPFSFSSLFTEEINFTLINNGHTIVAEQNRSSIVTISGGNLNGFYFLENFHLHWGPNENVGSEHQINGIKYSGESHFFFRNNQTNESVVLAFFMKDEDENPFISKEKLKRTNEWTKYFNLTQYLIHKNDSIKINLNLSLLMLENLNDFWRYNGSLTIPPCTENVIWIIFKQPISIFNYEFETFRDDLFFESYRGPQNLFQRIILRSFINETLSSIPDQNCCSDKQPKPNSSSSFRNSFRFYLLFIFFILK